MNSIPLIDAIATFTAISALFLSAYYLSKILALLREIHRKLIDHPNLTQPENGAKKVPTSTLRKYGQIKPNAT